jgi:CRISPR-associated endonuclease Csn1
MIREGDYVLGLRVGCGSLGWVALTLDEKSHPISVLAMGTRKYPIGAAGDVESGRESSHNSRRQEARSARVRLARRVARMRSLWNALQGAGLLPPGSFKNRDAIFKTFDGKLDKAPYLLRAKALDAALTPHELGRAIYHLAQRRGFQSNRKQSLKETEELGVVKQGISVLQTAMTAAGARTVGEYLSKLDASIPLRRRWTSRAMYRAEFDAIMAVQKLPPQITARLARIIFTQRPLRSQSHKIGRCELEPARRRAQLAGLDAQEFRVLCRVNDLRLVDDVGAEEVELNSAQRQTLLELLRDGDTNFPAIRKALGLASTVRFNAERIDDEKLIGFRTEAKLRKTIGNDVSDRMLDGLVNDLCNIDDDAGLKKRLLSTGFTEEQTAALLSVNLEPGVASLSHKAIARLLPLLRNGTPYATARKEIYPDIDHHEELELLPLVQEAFPHLSNPLVARALTELRVVINAIVKKYGRPKAIRVSLMRELRLGRKARERAGIKMRVRNKQRAIIAARILKDMGVQEPPRWMVDKVLLADECGWVCPFTGKAISMRSLVGGEPQFETAHIIPFHQSLDDSFENKTLCHVSRLTGNRSIEPKALRDMKTLARFEQLTGPFAKEKNRRIKLSREDIVKEFSEEAIASRFVDSCYTSKLAVDFLSRLYPSSRNAVTGVRGAISAYVREGCGLNRIDLPHGSFRRGTLDAAAVAACGPGIVRKLSTAALGALPGKRRLDPGEVLPWPMFARDVQESLDKIVVSARVRKKVSGPLHEETFYRHEGEMKGRPVYSVRKHLWQITPSDVPFIVGDKIREVVAAKLAELREIDPRKAFMKPENLPTWRGASIRRVRITRTDALFTIGEGARKKHVAVERNHHATVFMRIGRGGRMLADRVVVSQFEAQERLVKRQPIVQFPDGTTPVPGLETLSVLDTVDCRAFGKGIRTVRCVSKDPSIVLTGIDDGRRLAEIGEDRLRISVEQLRVKGAKKIVITPLGELLTPQIPNRRQLHRLSS